MIVNPSVDSHNMVIVNPSSTLYEFLNSVSILVMWVSKYPPARQMAFDKWTFDKS